MPAGATCTLQLDGTLTQYISLFDNQEKWNYLLQTTASAAVTNVYDC